MSLVFTVLGSDPLNPARPSNDDCVRAAWFDAGPVIVGTLLGATNDGFDPCAGSTDNADVYYRFIAPRTGRLAISSCGTHDRPALDAGTDVTLSIVDACAGFPGRVLACNDNWTGAASANDPFCGLATDAGVPGDATVGTRLTEGQEVLVRVSHAPGGRARGFELLTDFQNLCDCDLTDFGRVSIADLLFYLDGYLTGSVTDADFNTDGRVTVVDLLGFLDCWIPLNQVGACD